MIGASQYRLRTFRNSQNSRTMDNFDMCEASYFVNCFCVVFDINKNDVADSLWLKLLRVSFFVKRLLSFFLPIRRFFWFKGAIQKVLFENSQKDSDDTK